MEKLAYIIFGAVTVIAVVVLFLAVMPAREGRYALVMEVQDPLEDCKYACAVSLHQCRAQAVKNTELCSLARNECVRQQRAQELACNDQYWKCRSACAQQPGVAVVPLRR